MSLDRIFMGVSIAGFVALTLLSGMCWGMTNIPPAEFVRAGVLGIMRMGMEEKEELEPDYWLYVNKRPRWQAGVTVYDPQRSYGSYTVYLNTPGAEALLVDMEGRVRHRWHLSFSEVWDETAPNDEPIDERIVRWNRVKMMSNGDAYVIFTAHGIWPYGRGLVKLDKDSRVLWKNLDFIHHDLDIGEDGYVYAISQAMEYEYAPHPGFRPPYLNDHIVKLDSLGNTMKRISLVEAIEESPFGEGLFTFLRSNQDHFHANNVDYVTESMARWHPYANPGELLISISHLSSLVLLDPETGEISWAMRGPWQRIHDPDLLENGNVLIFDNQGHLGAGGRSRVLEFDPHDYEVSWKFEGDSEFRFDSEVRGSQQRLDNGNTLITESEAGRIFEVTPAGEVVWEYWNPSIGPARDQVGAVRWGERFVEEDIGFPFNYGVIANEE